VTDAAAHPVLSVNRLTARYTRFDVVKDVSIYLNSNEVCAVVGPNGAGKSSLLRAIMAAVPHVNGSVRLGDTELVGRRTHDIAMLGIAYVPEGRGILNSLTVRENLQLAVRRRRGLQRTAPQRAEALDAAADRFLILRQRIDQPAGQLSGGEQQMLAVSRALAWAPRVLLIDEPSLGLAPQVRTTLAAELRRIAADDGISVLLAEQDTKFAEACADRGYVLSLGQLLEEIRAFTTEDGERIRRSYLGGVDASPAATSDAE